MHKKTAAQLAHVEVLKKNIMYQKLFGIAVRANPMVCLHLPQSGTVVVAIKAYDKFSKEAIAREKEKEMLSRKMAETNKVLEAELQRS